MRYLLAILIAAALLLTPIVWHVSAMLFPPPPAVGGGGSAVDSAARIEIELLRGELEAMQARIVGLETKAERTEALIARLQEQGSYYSGDPGADTPLRDGENLIESAYAEVVLIANRTKVNTGMTVPTSAFLEQFLGRPRSDLSDACQQLTNPRLRDILYNGDVGPIRVTMLRPAVESLTRVFERVRQVDEDLYNRINTSGSLCVRRIRGTRYQLSSHSFGLAVDLNIDGQLDGFTDGKTQLGLTIMADFFREEGWIWGAGFSREDSMHFEVSRETLEEWRRQGLI